MYPDLTNPRVSSNLQLLQASPVSQVETLSYSTPVPDCVVWRVDPLPVSGADGVGKETVYSSALMRQRNNPIEALNLVKDGVAIGGRS